MLFLLKIIKQAVGKSTNNQVVDSIKIYQAKLVTPFAVLGIRTEEDWLTDIEYLPIDTKPLARK